MKLKKIWADEFSTVTINEIDNEKKEQIKKSMLKDGYVGEPVAYCNMGLLTGTHRTVAAIEIEEIEIEIADFTDEINDYCERHDICYDELAFDLIDGMSIEDMIKYFKG